MAAVGVYGPEVVLNGAVQTPTVMAAASITVKNLDGSAATLYTDATGATTTSNVVLTDSLGQLTFYAAPGSYLLVYTNSIGAQSIRVEVEMSASVANATYLVKVAAPTGTAATDTAAVQAALTAAGTGGGLVTLQAGTYALNAALQIPSGVKLHGQGLGVTVLSQATAGTPALVSKNYVSANGISPSGFTEIRDLTVTGGSGAGGIGIILRDFYSLIDNVQALNCGGDGFRLTHLNDASASVAGKLVENRCTRLKATGCGGLGFNGGAGSNNKLTDGLLSDFIANTCTGGAVYIGSAAGWIVRGVHCYGGTPTNVVNLENAFNTEVEDIYAELGFTNAALLLTGAQQSIHVRGVTAIFGATNNLVGVGVLKHASYANPDVTIHGLTIIQNNAATTGSSAVYGDNTALRILVSGLTVGGTSAATVGYLGGTGLAQTVGLSTGQTYLMGGVVPGDTTAFGGTLYSGSGAPGAGLGANGDYYLRTGTPGTANQRLYVKSAGAWVGIV